jgi:hypothetical protein
MDSWIQICEANTKLSVSFPKILFLWVDGTDLKTWGPSDTESARAMYNSKHGYHGYVFFVVVLPNGFISFASLSSTGNEHDKTYYDQSDCSDLLQEAYETIPEGCRCAIFKSVISRRKVTTLWRWILHSLDNILPCLIDSNFCLNSVIGFHEPLHSFLKKSLGGLFRWE